MALTHMRPAPFEICASPIHPTCFLPSSHSIARIVPLTITLVDEVSERTMMRFLVLHVGSVVVMFTVMTRTLEGRRDITTRIKLIHYIFVSFLMFMSVSGLSQASWTLTRLLKGDMVASLQQHFIALRELTPIVAVTIWTYGAIGTSTTALLTLGVARSNGQCRAALLRLFPLLVAAECVASLISMRGAHGIARLPGVLWEYVIGFCFWSLFAWPYLFAYRFYRGAPSDVLFAEPESEITDIWSGND